MQLTLKVKDIESLNGEELTTLYSDIEEKTDYMKGAILEEMFQSKKYQDMGFNNWNDYVNVALDISKNTAQKYREHFLRLDSISRSFIDPETETNLIEEILPTKEDTAAIKNITDEELPAVLDLAGVSSTPKEKKEAAEVFEEVKKEMPEATSEVILEAAKEKKLKKQEQIKKRKEEYTEATKRDIKHNRPEVHHRDCIEFMEGMDSNSIDLLITDPPYSTDIEDIETFAKKWVTLALDKLKKTGRGYICIGAYPKELKAYLDILMNQDKFIVDNPLIWTYRNTLGQTPKRKYNLNYQVILHLYSGESADLDTSITNEMFSVQDINAPDGRLGDRYHTWQKPDELAYRFIKHSSKEGDTVFDPFACTGTFLIAASKFNRKSLGCDISDENLKISEERGCHVVY